MQDKKRIAVIGAGIVGICNAKSLIDAGFSVTLFDEHGVAQRCSKGNAGHFATEQVFPLAQSSILPKLPSMLLDPKGALRIDWRYLFKAMPWFLRFVFNMRKSAFNKNTQALKALNEQALDAYKSLLGETEFNALLHIDGSLLTFEHTSDDKIDAIEKSFTDQGVAIKRLKGKEVFEVEPNLSPSIKQALYFTEVGHSADPYHLCQYIYKQFSAAGGEFIQGKVADIDADQSNATVHMAAGEKHTFDKVVVATGAWSKPLAKKLGFKVPLDTERGYHSMVSGSELLTRPVASAERQFIITPMNDGLRLAGTVEFAGLDAPENTPRATMLLDHASAMVSGLGKPDIKKTWMGHRPSLPDSLPVIGQSPDNKNIYFSFGHQHLGLTQAAITAKLITQLCSNIQPSLDLTPYRIDRF